MFESTAYIVGQFRTPLIPKSDPEADASIRHHRERAPMFESEVYTINPGRPLTLDSEAVELRRQKGRLSDAVRRCAGLANRAAKRANLPLRAEPTRPLLAGLPGDLRALAERVDEISVTLESML